MDFGRIIKNILFLLVAVFSGLLLLLITIGVTSGTELNPLNNAVADAVSHIRTPLLTSLMLLITNLGAPLVLSVFAILLAIVLLLERDTYDALLYLVSIFLAVISFTILKNTLAIPRPAGNLIEGLNTWSFPSGHATVATAFFFATGYSFFHWPKVWVNKIILVVSCIVAASLISFSRVYLAAHFALDVLAGVALGLLSVSFTALIFNLFLSEREWWRRRIRNL